MFTVCNLSKNRKHSWFLLSITWWIMWLYLHGCTILRAKFCSLLGQFYEYFVFFYSLRSLCFKVLLGIISSSFSTHLTTCSNKSLHCLLLYHLLFLALARSSTPFLFILALCRFLPTLHQSNYILKMLDQPSLSFVVQLIAHKSRQEHVAFLSSPVRVYFETSLPFPQILYGWTDRHCSYGDVITTFSRHHD